MPTNHKFIHVKEVKCPPNEYFKIQANHNIMFKDSQCVNSYNLTVCNQYITPYCTCLKIAYVLAVAW